MKELNTANVTLAAALSSCFIQMGAQLYALIVIAGTIAKAPPRSFAMFEGQYGYDSSAFWNTVPPITAILLLVALIANWKTVRRKLLLFAIAMFIVGSLMAGFVVEPVFAELIAIGYSDQVDPALQARAAKWYALDWTLWGAAALAAVALLLAFMRPVNRAKDLQ